MFLTSKVWNGFDSPPLKNKAWTIPNREWKPLFRCLALAELWQGQKLWLLTKIIKTEPPNMWDCKHLDDLQQFAKLETMHQQNQWVLGQKKSQNVIHGQLVGGWVQNRRHQPGGVAPHQADNALLKVFRICGSMGLQNHQAVKTNHGLSTKNWEEDHQN